jgi:Gpi18-like mannosyltransferase
MLVWVGVAVSFKAQAAFLAPFVFAVLLRARRPWPMWLVPPAVYALVMTPAWLAGWPAADLLLVYIRQAGELPGFISAAPQPWIVVRWLRPDWAPDAFILGYVAALLATGAIAFGLQRHLSTVEGLLLVALLSASLLPFLLPKMHERYLLLADMLAICLALSHRTAGTIALAALVQSASLLALAGYTHSAYLPLLVGFVAALAGLILTAVLLPRAQRGLAASP